ncbi:GlcNAc transferase [Tieghemostelium lacteum]|uniref:alpha-1,3-mannosyl-glycoprotein 2-beta-N-acetylglucosaminyltransferase n=1 Tax=Tieghemostelium lacteum TaxID=361077 RepID=A0A152A379_TIELA|nr:GlcNAc transferase [Tieghemostelium lacteum]|eukprot:KYR00722.1 GlcNAc transferase [Tieghemostelium lacteum]
MVSRIDYDRDMVQLHEDIQKSKETPIIRKDRIRKSNNNNTNSVHKETLEENIKNANTLHLDNDIYSVYWTDTIPDHIQESHPYIAIMTSNKPDHLDRLILNLLKNALVDPDRILVFNDGVDPVLPILEKYEMTANQLVQNSQTHTKVKGDQNQKDFYINQHYRFMFSFIFDRLHLENIIVLEDDLVLSSDSMGYFTLLSRLMKYDPSIFCVSAWNDNAYLWNSIPDEPLDHLRFSFKRQNHFGGLGFLINNRTYFNRIEPAWREEGANYKPWDTVVQNSMLPEDSCIYPSVPRSQHSPILSRNYKAITSKENEVDEWSFMQFYNPADFFVDGKYMKVYRMTMAPMLQPEYDFNLDRSIRASVEIDSLYAIGFLTTSPHSSFVFYHRVYSDKDKDWELVTKILSLVGIGNGGVVRTVYEGVIETSVLGKRLYIVGFYSKFVFEKHRATKAKMKLNDLIKLVDYGNAHFNEALTKSYLFMLENDHSLHVKVAEQSESCSTHCKTHNFSCKEPYQILLLNSGFVEYSFTSQKYCKTIKIAENSESELGNLPSLYSATQTCVLPNNPSKISCSYTPAKNENVTRKLCICNK